MVVVVVVCTGGEVPWNAVWESQTHASWRGGLQALGGCRRRGVEGGGVAASIFALYRRRRVKLYTDNGSGRRGGLLKWP